MLPHGQDHRSLAADQAFNTREESIRAVWIALGLLLCTALLQTSVGWAGGGVSLLADSR